MSRHEQLPDQPTALAELVEYAEGSVVSRTLVKGPTGTVTLFAFDAGNGLSEHTAPYDAIIIGVDGEARITLGAVSHDLATGDVLRLPANEPHAVDAIGRFKMLLVMIRAPTDGS